VEVAVDPVEPSNDAWLAFDQEGSIVALHRAHYEQLARLAGLLLGDRGAGEEVAQEAFARLWVSWPSLRDPASAAGYLRASTVNLSRSRLRRLSLARRHGAVLRPLSLDVQEGSDALGDRMLLRQTLAKLPRRQREAVLLRYFADLSESDVAAAMDISQGAVKSHLHRALASLAKHLGERP
jgi:RNA polymerase sigma-70 factor (sigma-E family)